MAITISSLTPLPRMMLSMVTSLMPSRWLSCITALRAAKMPLESL